MNYIQLDIKEAELLSAISIEWRRAADIKDILGIKDHSVKTVAKSLARIMPHHPEIETVKMRGVFFYRIKPGTIITSPVTVPTSEKEPEPKQPEKAELPAPPASESFPQSILDELKEPEPEPEHEPVEPIREEPTPISQPTIEEPASRNHDLSTIVKELREFGVDVQYYVFTCLKEKHASVKQEYDYVLQHAPTIAQGYKRLQDELAKSRNKILDLQDEKVELMRKTMVKRFIEEKKVSEGIR